MNKLIQIFTFSMAALMSVFSPMQITQGSAGCCAECAMKKEDEVEYVEEEVQEDKI